MKNAIKEYADKFLSGEIDADKFWDNFNEHKNAVKKYQPWSTKEWKEKREKILKDLCECCGATDNLIAQHGWKPQTYKDLYSESKLFFESQRYCLISRKDGLNFVNAPSCPKCLSTNIKKLKTGNFKCYNNTVRVVKEYIKVFEDKPSLKLSDVKILKVGEPTPEIPGFCGWYGTTESDEKIFFMSREKCKNEFQTPTIHTRLENMVEFGRRKAANNESILKSIKQRATKEWVSQTMAYQSLENVKTYCRRCAYLEDKSLEFIKENK